MLDWLRRRGMLKALSGRGGVVYNTGDGQEDTSVDGAPPPTIIVVARWITDAAVTRLVSDDLSPTVLEVLNQPNTLLKRRAFYTRTIRDLLLVGNAFWDPTVEPGQLAYVAGSTFNPDEPPPPYMVHLRYGEGGENPRWGYPLWKTLGTDSSTDKRAARVLERRMRVGEKIQALLSATDPNNPFAKPDYERLVTIFKGTPVGVTDVPADLQFLTELFSPEEIAYSMARLSQVYGLHPAVLGFDPDANPTYNNIRPFARMSYRNGVQPLQNILVEGLREAFPQLPADSDLRWDTGDIPYLSRQEEVIPLLEAGVVSAAYVRRELGITPEDDPEWAPAAPAALDMPPGNDVG